MRRLAAILAFLAFLVLAPADDAAAAGNARFVRHHFGLPALAAAPRRLHHPHHPRLRKNPRGKFVIAQQGYPSFRRPRLIPRRKLPPRFRAPDRPRQGGQKQRGKQNDMARLTPSQALRIALRASPGSLGLGVDLLPPRPGRPPAYAVKLKTGSRIHRILVNAVNGRVIRR